MEQLNSKFLDDHRQMEQCDFRFFFKEKTRWGDADTLGHINNVMYARYYESTRVAYFEQLLGLQFVSKMPVGVITADMGISYLEQLHYPAEMIIGARVSRIGKSSFSFDSAIFVGENTKPVSTSRTTQVWFDFEQNQSKEIPCEVRTKMIEYEIIAPLQSQKT
ncbi:thioesterase family protein [Cocleimonas sp. KMM 6892]|uniref:acyl-CoA thioesterase n=1 Tax=unclassified Cocleimonas TaxID=2639732 RepID=UPI002DBB0F2B|nr:MULTISPECIES: thioesterase family protein [unclassified Cocleimonas]MEB8432596.1 thioesterase family protein [Cocleimonas sp. KMM 6892]MEC4715455.1 thioesterase family protein [Cocleimonas sp. KMM 6895]MEC4744927.1 thioesterase family protein [Cocleimonas sp. KMM 6896]